MDAAHPSWNPWANDRSTLELYRRRCRQEAEEMTCAGQVADLLSERISKPERLLDAGCGGGYYAHSFLKRGVPVEYFGLDYTTEMIELAQEEVCPRAGLDPRRYKLGSIESLDEEYDTIICFNVLTNSPHYALPLGRLMACARRRVVIRESMGDDLVVRFTPDRYLDEGKQHIRVYHNTYPIDDVEDFMRDHRFDVTRVRDERCGDGVEMVCDIPHRWRILLAERP